MLLDIFVRTLKSWAKDVKYAVARTSSALELWANVFIEFPVGIRVGLS